MAITFFVGVIGTVHKGFKKGLALSDRGEKIQTIQTSAGDSLDTTGNAQDIYIYPYDQVVYGQPVICPQE